MLPVLAQALAVLEERQGNVAEARRLLEAAVKQDPQHVQSWQVCLLICWWPSVLYWQQAGTVSSKTLFTLWPEQCEN